MYNSQWPWVELFQALWNDIEIDAYSEVLEPWLQDNPEECRWFKDFAERSRSGIAEASSEDLCRLYAASRVTTILLLNFQSKWADKERYYRGPTISVEGFQLFHESLGCHVPESLEYHPFFHEILEAIPKELTGSAIQRIQDIWPSLMLGSMMYCRAGCIVSGGRDHVVKAIAEKSKMYWTFRRFNRPYEDLSLGWGSNSQWRTAFRRDYRLSGRYFFNVDGEESLNQAINQIDELDLSTAIELVRNRCLIRTVANDNDLSPYQYSYNELS